MPDREPLENKPQAAKARSEEALSSALVRSPALTMWPAMRVSASTTANTVKTPCRWANLMAYLAKLSVAYASLGSP